jgi:hypothetical protein
MHPDAPDRHISGGSTRVQIAVSPSTTTFDGSP